MDLWTRNSDRRYYWAGLERDLFGLVVVIAHGGRHRPPRVRAAGRVAVLTERKIAFSERGRAFQILYGAHHVGMTFGELLCDQQ